MRIERKADGTASIHVAGREVAMPRSRGLRVALALALMIGGVLGFLPVLGLWMMPLGLLVLAIDYPPAGRLARNIMARWRLWRRRRKAEEERR